MKYKNIQYWIFSFTILMGFGACTPGGDFAGREYMPDMAHSTAYEANVITYYEPNTWGGEEEVRNYSFAKLPVNGTIARGESSYYYGDSEAERTRASEELINSALSISDKGIKEGKELFNIYCGICHGEKGDGDGYLVRDDGGVYPAQPANLVSDDFINSTNGRFYHAIMYGKNVMSGYADKLSADERWNVIHYIRSLQAKVKGVEYNETNNTLNSWAVPASKMHSEAKMTSHSETETTSGTNDHEETKSSEEHSSH